MHSSKIQVLVLLTVALPQLANAELKHVAVKAECKAQLPDLETSYQAEVRANKDEKADSDRYIVQLRAQDAAAHENMESQVKKLEQAQILDTLRDFDRGKIAATTVSDTVASILQISYSSTVSFNPTTLVLTVVGKPVVYHDVHALAKGRMPAAASPAEGETVEQSQYELWLGEKSGRDEKHFTVPAKHTDEELKARAQWLSFNAPVQRSYDDFLRAKLDPGCFGEAAAVSTSQ